MDSLRGCIAKGRVVDTLGKFHVTANWWDFGTAEVWTRELQDFFHDTFYVVSLENLVVFYTIR